MNAPARADEHGRAESANAGGARKLAWAVPLALAGQPVLAGRWPRRPGERARPGPPGVPALVTALVVAVTVAVRIWPLLGNHMLGGLLEYDDGVYYDASAHLIGGALPYRDFAFVQPPGVVVLLAPFAALARLAGDQAAVIAARLAVLLVAGVNAFLLMRLVRRWAGRVAAVMAGVTYAVWGGAAAAERTVLLEPLLSLGLLAAMTLLGDAAGPAARPGPDPPGPPAGDPRAAHLRRLAAAGVVLGLALAVKTWTVVDIVVLAGWVLRRSGWRAATTLAGAASGTAAAVCLPFFLAAPAAMIRQVIADQLGRTERLTPDPVVFLHELAGVGQVYGRAGAPPAAAIAVLSLLALAISLTLWRGPGRIWAVLAIASIALVVPQRSYTYHYMDFAAPALAACVGIAAAAPLRAARRAGIVTAAVAGAAAVAVAAALAWQSVTQDVVGSQAQAGFGAFFAAHPCAFSDYPSLLAAAGAETRQVRLRCANLVDYTGAALAAGDGRMLVSFSRGGRLYRSPAWQAEVRRVLAMSDAAVLSWRPQRWTPTTWQLFHHRFTESAQLGYFTLWVVRA